LLFYGPPGTGKTSTILACAKMIYGKSYKSMILEVLLCFGHSLDAVARVERDFLLLIWVWAAHGG
jgi:replication factor C subunit 3/5